MVNKLSKKENAAIPRWIRELFPQTWYQELVMTGITIYALLQLPDYLPVAITKLYFLVDSSANSFIYMLTFDTLNYFLVGAAYVLLINYIFHLILRGFWIGIVGLYSAFPLGINFDKITFGEYYKKRIKKKTPDFNVFVEKIDNVCSSVYAFAFMVSLMSIGIAIFLCLNILLISLFSTTGVVHGNGFHLSISGEGQTYKMFLLAISLLILWFFAIIHAFDFISMGLIKRIKWFRKIYFPFYWFFGMLFLAPLYRPIYYVFYTNMNKIKLLLLLSLYLFSFFIIIRNYTPYGISEAAMAKRASMSNGENQINPNYYISKRSLTQKKPSIVLHSDIVEESYLKIYMKAPQFSFFNNMLLSSFDDNLREKVDSTLDISSNSKSYLKAFTGNNKLYINDSLVQNPVYMIKTATPTSGFEIIAYISLRKLNNGLNYIRNERFYEYSEEKKRNIITGKDIIPFFVP